MCPLLHEGWHPGVPLMKTENKSDHEMTLCRKRLCNVMSMCGSHWTRRLLATGGQGQILRQQRTPWKLVVLGELLSLVGWG